jgi:hypothetical protein
MPYPACVWTSTDTAIATVNSSGQATGVTAGGPVTIRATSGDISGTASITIFASSPTGPDLTVWIGKWIKMNVQNGGYYEEDRNQLSNDREMFSAYLKITSWDPGNKVLQGTLAGHDSGDNEEEGRSSDAKPWSVPVSLHYTSGTNVNFKCWSQITIGDNSYNFTARVVGIMRKGVLANGILWTVGGYHTQSGGQAQTLSSTQDSSGWLRINGRLIKEEKVPSDLIEYAGP